VEAVRRLLYYDAYRGLWQYHECGPRRTKAWFAGAAEPKSRYLRIQIGARKYLAHRLAWLWMKGRWPKDEIDHIDGDRANNRWSNLREATHTENTRNGVRRTTNTSGFKGVTLKNGKWRATIRAEGRYIHLGYFPTADEAAAAYREASARFHGEYGRLQ
jgi:hypothetical protein